ncbi:MAG: hypothetical protein HW389_2337 [Bacteroidetes bacterium]|nr:hypothetical protein [Bacteroidota bacterium]
MRIAVLCSAVLLSSAFLQQSASAQSWFKTGQAADLMLSGVDFNNSGGALLFHHPTGIATDGTRFVLCDRFNNRVLIWNSLPTRWNTLPNLVLGQTDFTSNNPGTSKSQLNWPGNASIGLNGVLVVADTDNDRILIWNQLPTRDGQAANIEIALPKLSIPGTPRNYEWPWGVWTDGTKLIATATHGETIFFWNTLPTSDNQHPDYRISLPQFGTLRNISTDGKTYFFVSDHNAKVNGDMPGTFFWNSFPSTENQPFDFFREEWIKGFKLPNGQLVAGGINSVYVWNSVPTTATLNPSLTLRNNYYKNGDGPDVVYAGGRLYVNNYNGNNVQVYDSFPISSNQQPDWALGSPSISVNTLDSIHYIQNPVLASDGSRLIASSDFDRTLWIWNSFPTKSGKAPDKKMSLSSFDLAPWDNAIYDGKLVLAGKKKIVIWESLPLNGEPPNRIFADKLGSVQFQEIKGVALDSACFSIADQNGMVYVWNTLPISGTENPVRTLSFSSQSLNHLNSDGTYLCVSVQGNPPGIYIYRIAELKASVNPQPFKSILSSPNLPLNLPAEAVTFDGSLAIANTSNNSVFLWKNIQDAGTNNGLVILGQPSPPNYKPAIGSDRLFMPASMTFAGNSLWVGEMKFSSRILRFRFTDQATNVHDKAPEPTDFVLLQNYPNPFNSETVIRYQLSTAGEARLSVIDLLGRELRTLVDARQSAGVYRVVFDAGRMPSGVYFYLLNVRSSVQTKAMTLMK